MFNGLIREIAEVVSFKESILTLRAKYSPKIGDSIAVNGACLTAISVTKNSFSVELSHESKNILALENYKNRVHIEPAMMLKDRVDGHLMQGHIDTIGEIIKIENIENGYDVYIKIDKAFLKYTAPKGSIAIDGVSLTINSILEDGVRLTIIPHTFKNTLFSEYKKGRVVNIEFDMFAKMVFNFLDRDKNRGVSWESIEKITALY